ncbi:cell division protein SepF [Methanobrevibacter sp.]|uniref:cell division protein SepF n=1 Tax=Methanobrevibacter sp. TaxID=66852 RepID=UPI0025D66D8B|nr:cell division protein SepF [uncultured Methanobrevibacter sp.]
MSFTDNLKKSLGFEEDDFGTAYGISDYGEEDFFEDEFTTISPEQTFYEIVLIRPKSVDDMDYIFDQIVEENNPVILDLKFLEKQSEKDFRQAGEILKLLRHQYGAEAILLSQTEDKNLIIVTPSRVKLVRKD